MAYLHKEPIESSAATLKSLFQRDPASGRFQIGELLDLMMEPSHQASVDRRENLAEWVKALFTTEKSFEQFCAKVSTYDRSRLCGCVWTKDFMAYRCKTCASSPCMSICAACFEGGDHAGHEYSIFRSEAGGACDCGDESVMSREGFCRRHGLNKVVTDKVPDDLLTLPKFIMERAVVMLLHNLRFMAKADVVGALFFVRIPDPVSETIDVLIEVIKCGSLVRSWLADLLLSEDYYESLNTNKHYGGIVTESAKKFHSASLEYLRVSKKKLPKCPVPEEMLYIMDFFESNLVCKNLLQEFTFWLCRFQFPKTLILFLLNILPDERIKLQLSKAFVHQYIYIPPSLVEALEVEEYSNRIVHMSVQLFSNAELAFLLSKEDHLLEIFVMALDFMVTKTLVDSKTSESDFHQVVHMSGSGMLNNAYWAVVSDFINCLGHRNVAELFLSNEVVLRIWMRVLTCFSAMDHVRRHIDFHVEYDHENALLGFYTEREACAGPLWVMLDALPDSRTVSLSRKVLELCVTSIVELLDALGVGDNPEWEIPFNVVSFHYPIHRYFALFASNAVSRQGMKIQDMQLDERLARRLMAHPLRVICSMHEVLCQMWVRNGASIATRQLAYRQSLFCGFFLDADLFTLQLCANFINPNSFVSSVFLRCRVAHCLVLSDEPKQLSLGQLGAVGQPEEEKLNKMLESAFSILISVVGVRTHLGMSDNEILVSEVVAILGTSRLTHSNLTGRIPQCHDTHACEKVKRFSEPLMSVIDELAYKIEGDAMTQTLYDLKDNSWEKYDPAFTRHRVLYKHQVQRAHTNYFKYLQRTNKVSSGTLESNIWTPYLPIRIRDPRFAHLNGILNCRALHSVIFVVLYKYLHEHGIVTEQCLTISLALLEAALCASSDEEDLNSGSETGNFGFPLSVPMLYDCDNMTRNIRITITQIQVHNESSCDTDDADEPMEDDSIETSVPPTNVGSPIGGATPEQYLGVNESIISMLIKLHERYLGASEKFSLPAELPRDFERRVDVPDGANVTKQILMLAAVRSSENLDAITAMRPRVGNNGDGASISERDAERMRRKLKAREMQKRLLQDFAKKQREFLEQVDLDLDLDLPETSNDRGNADTSDEDKYRCVICSSLEPKYLNVTPSVDKHSTNTRSKIMCLIGLAQTSALLGHRMESDDRKPVPPGTAPVEVKNCRRVNEKIWDSLRLQFPTQYDNPSIGHCMGWELAPHVSTCGHHVHATCFEEYVKWVRRDTTGYLRFEGGVGFMCPLCRQTSNVAVPCNIARVARDDSGSEMSSGRRDDCFNRGISAIQRNILRKRETLTTLSSLLNPEDANYGQHDEVFKACLKSLDGIHSERAAMADGRTNIRSLLRGQLEYGLCKLGGALRDSAKLPALSPVKRNLPIGPMFHVVAKVVSTKTTLSHCRYVDSILDCLTGGALHPMDSVSCPVLFKDPFTMLLEICLSFYPLAIEEYRAATRVVYNLCLIRALIHVCCKFSSDERSAWKAKASRALENNYDASNLNCLLGHVITRLPDCIYDGNVAGASAVSSPELFTSTVWTKQSVENTVTEFCLHYMRLASLLQFHIFQKTRFRARVPVRR